MTHKLTAFAALLLALAAPARATITVSAALGTSPFYVNATMNSSVTQGIVVEADGELDVQDGGSVTAFRGGGGITVNGGIVNISGGSVSGDAGTTIHVYAGALNIRGGSVSTPSGNANILLDGGTGTISGGSVSGFPAVQVSGPASLAVTDGSVTAIWSYGTLTVSGGSIGGIDVWDGTTTVSDGVVSSANTAIRAEGGATIVSGGSVSGGRYGILAATVSGQAASLTLTGGSVSGGDLGIYKGDVAVSVAGCGLLLAANGTLTGNLADGRRINTPTLGLATTDLQNTPPLLRLNDSSAMTWPCHTPFVDPGAAAGNCAGSLPVTVGGSLDVDTLGTYTLTYNAADAAGIAAPPVTRKVTITDTQRPSIAAAAAASASAPASQCAALVALTAPAASDNCGVPTVTGARSDGKRLTDPYPVGATIVTWTATDGAGNQATSPQTVTVTGGAPAPAVQIAAALQAGMGQVQQLVTSKVLKPAEGAVLTGVLQLALQTTNRRTSQLTAADVTALRGFLQSFINGVNNLVSQHRLTSAQGAALFSVAQAILNALGSPCA